MTAPTRTGAFVQLIEYRTSTPERVEELITTWVDAIGAARTTRWYVICADRDRPKTYVELVEFPSYEDAMRNSAHPATDDFARGLRDVCTGLEFRNLDVTVAATT